MEAEAQGGAVLVEQQSAHAQGSQALAAIVQASYANAQASQQIRSLFGSSVQGTRPYTVMHVLLARSRASTRAGLDLG